MAQAEVVLPRLAGSRSAARALVDEADGPLEDAVVTLDCKQLRSAPPSYADEIVLVVLVEGGARTLALRYASAEFEGYIRESAQRRGIDSSRIDVLVSETP